MDGFIYHPSALQSHNSLLNILLLSSRSFQFFLEVILFVILEMNVDIAGTHISKWHFRVIMRLNVSPKATHTGLLNLT